MSTALADVTGLSQLIDAGLEAQRTGDRGLAAACYERVLTLAPANFDGLQLLGLLRVQMGDSAAGIALLERAVAADPRQTCALNNLGNVLFSAGRIREAVDAYRRALAVDPMEVTVLTNLALTLLHVGEFRFAAKCIDRALSKDPQNGALQFALGHLLHEKGLPKEAVQAYRQALALGLTGPGTYLSLGLTLQNLGDEEGAHTQFEAAERLTPTQTLRVFRGYAALQTCLWERFGEDARALDAEGPRADEAPVDPMRTLFFPISAARQSQYAQRHAADLARTGASIARAAWVPPAVVAEERQRLRIAYVSPDFRDHAVGYLIGPVLAAHDREKVEVHGYGWRQPGPGGVRERIVAACDHFHVVDSLTDEALVDRLRGDAIDIVIDLAGYTANNRSSVLAARVAPLQVSWLGYPGTTGGTFMDYVIADEYIIPPQHDAHFTESVVRLPHTYLPYDPARPTAVPLTRAEYGLPDGAVVLACLGQVRKVNPLVFDAWMDVLKKVPEAVLWLASTYAPAIENLHREAEARGVGRERLIFAGPVDSQADHLARYRIVDLALDTFPYGSHATAADALWAGCPLVAVVGESFASRVSGSIVRSAGLSELVAESLERYRALLHELVRDPYQRQALRARLQALRSTCPLFDIARFVRWLENAYLTMWQRRQRGDPPAAFRVPDDSTASS